jgi:hypothetical protein
VQSVEKWHQQADRIKDLEKLLEHSVGADCREMRYIQEIENKDARIAELEKQQKTEPDFYSEQGYPLYTTPQIKQLSDEEIHQIFRDESGFEIDTCPIAILDFARAILKKASQ